MSADLKIENATALIDPDPVVHHYQKDHLVPPRATILLLKGRTLLFYGGTAHKLRLIFNRFRAMSKTARPSLAGMAADFEAGSIAGYNAKWLNALDTCIGCH